MRRLLLAACAALTLSVCAYAAAGGPGSAPEPDGLFTGALQSYTTSTLKGATVVEDADAVAGLIDKGGVTLIDVLAEDQKPANLPAGVIWRPQHRSIPGAVWFPGAAPGDLPPAREAALKARVTALTGGDLDRPVVAFCRPDCWGSWNMGKRLVLWGYTKVYWFPGGVDRWQESDRDTVVVKPDPDWMASAQAAER